MKTKDLGSYKDAYIMGRRNKQEALRNANWRGNRDTWNIATATSTSSMWIQQRISSTSTSQVNEPKAGTVGKNELESNTDTYCLGANFIILRYTQRIVGVYPYDLSYSPMTNITIITRATA